MKLVLKKNLILIYRVYYLRIMLTKKKKEEEKKSIKGSWNLHCKLVF